MAKVIIINGYPGSGKDTFIEFCKYFLDRQATDVKIHNIHTSDLAKEALKLLGWDGEKDLPSRTSLRQLMDISEGNYDGSFKYVAEQVKKAFNQDIVFVHCREWSNVKRYKKEFGATTLFIDRHVPVVFNNASDNNAGECKRDYDWLIYNDFSLEELKKAAERFMVYHI